ncbi:MAG: flavin-containing monooxygenase [Acidimicrobiales bacterium]
MTPAPAGPASGSDEFDVVVVGGGLAGVRLAVGLAGRGLRFCVLEAGDDVGGVWYWNRYPGARCDVDSVEYSYQFSEDLQQEWEWNERYGSQPEILRYIGHVVERFGVRDRFRFGHRLRSAVFDDLRQRWQLDCDNGARLDSAFVVMATGCLSSINEPPFPGREHFGGRVLHTGQWPHEAVEFTDRVVGVVGTGSSAVQAIPIIARHARTLYVFQRTAAYVVPARNRPADPDEVRAVKADYSGFRARNNERPRAFDSRTPLGTARVLDVTPQERTAVFQRRWDAGGLGFLGGFVDCMTDEAANAVAAEFIRDKIREIVVDHHTADLLSPRHLVGCKRLCLDSGYFETFNRDNVVLVDVSRQPIERFEPDGLRAAGRSWVLDDVVLATGFDAITGALLDVDIVGASGRSLREHWSDGPHAYLGLAMHGFPNLFTVTGPGSPSVLTNMVVSIEHHAEWIVDCIEAVRRAGHRTVEVTAEAEQDWLAHVAQVAAGTLFPRCDSWFLGANIPGKPRSFMPLFGFPAYRRRCTEVAEAGYEGFVLR